MSTITLDEFDAFHDAHAQAMPAYKTVSTDSSFTNSRMDWNSVWAAPPPPLDFVLPGFLLGTVGALIAPGGTGKSFWALQAAVCLATMGKYDPLNLNIGKERGGRVVILSLEDPQSVVRTRAYSITIKLPADVRSLIARNLDIIDRFGLESDLMNPAFFDSAAKYCVGARLIVIDTLSRAHLLDENKNGEMARLMVFMDALARLTGASVLFIHHISKGSNKDGRGNEATASRGASVLVDNARWVGFLQRMGDEPGVPKTEQWKYIKQGVSKINYGPPIPDSWLEKGNGGVLLFSKINTVNRGIDEAKALIVANDDIDDVIAQMNARDFPSLQTGGDDEIDF